MTRRRKQPARDRALRWLLNALECGPVTVEALRWQSHKARISWGTLRRAREGVAVSVRVAGIGSRGFWRWELCSMGHNAKTLAPDAKTLINGAVSCPVCGSGGGVR